jgi:large subunit ribosomal protein L5
MAKSDKEKLPEGEKAPEAEAASETEQAPETGKKPKGEKKAAGEKQAAKGDKQAKKAPKKEAAGAKGPGVPKNYVPRLLKKYREEIAPALMKKFNYKSPMEVPRLQKIVLNMGVGEASKNIKLLDDALAEMNLIAGQKPSITRARKSIAQFKIRAGMPIGCFVTLRGRRMYDFLDRLINVAIPRIRDFRGLSVNAFDGRGNHSIGVREQLIFVEIDYNKVTRTQGMNITAITSAKTDAECKELLALFGMPFRKN